MGHSSTLINVLDGYLTALSMGIILGVIGAAGSILTLPILVYLFWGCLFGVQFEVWGLFPQFGGPSVWCVYINSKRTKKTAPATPFLPPPLQRPLQSPPPKKT